MTNSNSSRPAEMLKENIAAMGQELGKIYSELWQDLNRLHHKYSHFNEAFGTSPERVDIFNATAPRFFGVVQASLWESILLQIARLTDPPCTAGKPNLSFSRLCALEANKPRSTEAKAALSAVENEAKFARVWRNKRIGHNDLTYALGEAVVPLPPASLARVDATLAAMASLMNLIEWHFLKSTTLYKFSGKSIPGGAYSTLLYLRSGLEIATHIETDEPEGFWRPFEKG